MKSKIILIRVFLISLFVIGLGGIITVDVIYNNPYINAGVIGFIFCLYGLIGAGVSDYLMKHDITDQVVGKTISNFINGKDFED